MYKSVFTFDDISDMVKSKTARFKPFSISDHYSNVAPEKRVLTSKEISNAYERFGITQYASKDEFLAHVDSRISPSQANVYWSNYQHREALISSGQYEELRGNDYRKNYIEQYKKKNGYSKNILTKLENMPTEAWIKLSSMQKATHKKKGWYLLPNIQVYYDKDVDMSKRNEEINKALDKVLTKEDLDKLREKIISSEQRERSDRHKKQMERAIKKGILEVGLNIISKQPTLPTKELIYESKRASIDVLTQGKRVLNTKQLREEVKTYSSNSNYSDIRFLIMYLRDKQGSLYTSYKDSSKGKYIRFVSNNDKTRYENWKRVRDTSPHYV